MAGVKIVDLPALGRDLINTDLLEVSLNGGGSRKITGQEIMNASKLAIGSTPIVSGTVGRLLFQGAGNVLSQPSSLFYDAVNNRLGIGTTTPGASLDVVYESTFQSRIDMYGTLYMYNNITSLSGNIWLNDGYAIGDWGTGNNRIEFYNNRMSFFGNGNEALRIVGSTGNLLVNTVTDAGFKFDVNGTARVQGNAQFGTGFYWDNTNNRLSVGTSTQAYTLAVGGKLRVSAYSYWVDSGANALQVDGTSSFSDNIIIASGKTLQFGTSATQIAGTTAGPMTFRAGSGSTQMTLFSTGNFAINTTTDAGYKLDVNGDSRLKGSGSTSVTYALTVQNSAGTNLLAVRNNNTTYIANTVTINAETPGGTGMVISHTAWNGSTGLSVNSATGIVAWSSLGANASNPDGASIVALGRVGGDPLRKSVGLRSNRAIISSGFAYEIVDSAMLQVDSTTQGFLPPRMTNAQRAAIASPAVGLIVYCTDATEGLYVYKSTGWTFMV